MAQVDMATTPMEPENTPSTAPVAHERKRPRVALDAEPRKKGRSIFGQAFGTLKKARDQDSKLQASDAVKKRTEIDNRIMGKITRDQTIVRQQDEAKRDRFTANRKEEDLAIKNSMMRLRRTTFPRLAGFLLTTDVIPSEVETNDALEPTSTSPDAPKANLAHPPPRGYPAPLYYLPAILTPAQQKFIAKQKAVAVEIVDEETKEWMEEKKKGIEEVAELRSKAAETLVPVEGEKSQPPPSPSAAAVDKMDVEEENGAEKVGEENAAATPIEEAATEKKQRPVVEVDMDAEDTIEY